MKRLAYALTGLVLTAVLAVAANIPLITGPQDPSQMNATINGVIQQINSGVTPASMGAFTNPRNLLDNGAMAVQQRGTGVQTCGTTTIPSTAYAADRWGCNVNVTSGAGRLQVITTAANLPASPAFTAGHVFYRVSGILTQPQCVMQEIATSRVTALQGTTLTISAYIQGLAAMLAESTTVNAYLFTGTGTDEGLQSFTASTAITPAFTGIATTGPVAWTITSSWARYSGQFSVPATATEAALALCWTPTAGGTGGVTDGFRFTGVQLEQGTTASAYEFQPYANEFATALRYFYKITESATAATTRGSCTNLTSSISNCVVPFPVPMAKVPTMTYATGFGIAVAAQTSYTACTANATSTTATSVASTLAVLMSCATSAAGGALGTSTTWGDSGGTGTISASADF